MNKFIRPWLVFVLGAAVGPVLYWVIEPTPWVQYGIGPLLWPMQLWEPVLQIFDLRNDAWPVALNFVLFSVVGVVVAAVAFNLRRLFVVAGLIEAAVLLLALYPVLRGERTVGGDGGVGVLLILIALLFYGALLAGARWAAK